MHRCGAEVVRMAASAPHETRTLLRALPAAASGCRHLNPTRPAHRRLLRPATGPVTARRTGFRPEAVGFTPGRQDGLWSEGRKSPGAMTNGAAFRFPAVAGSYSVRGAQCDGSHRKSFTKG
ncbi:hypothetical protein GCM10015535_64200 [Streptomyces gelaticus]|uniref:Uncharacterized protein n=1 Tax=Streptomyces gelaticus TaxID=285446 RepID=A0ABQ2W8L5_9ACTN|nr:DUF6274 family protein [Streptomyces gelaticus]GGV95861.1 hypothetical protein GCM10015535_64200 [Streptomyces gelaticus]